ncbi:MAG: hypothetical protein NCW75_01295 [Phycisphaera sp.]|nr:MAG: hypothetical protein NCW75_01295 [Phycisphaera sp.]
MGSPRYPDKEALLLAWARHHATVWAGGQAGPPDTGLDLAQIQAFEATVSAAEDSLVDRTAKKAAAKASTTAKKNAFKLMKNRLSSCVATIDAYVKDTQDEGVYVRAELDPPKEPSERPAPAKPGDLSLTSFSDGSLRLAFKVAAAGAVFEVQRSTTDLVGQESPWATIAVTGEKMHTDPAVPGGLRSVSYRVRGIIGNNNTGAWSTPEPLNFGSQGSQAGPATAADAA